MSTPLSSERALSRAESRVAAVDPEEPYDYSEFLPAGCVIEALDDGSLAVSKPDHWGGGSHATLLAAVHHAVNRESRRLARLESWLLEQLACAAPHTDKDTDT